MPDSTIIGSFALNPSGGQILTPPLVERETYGYRIVLEGVLRFGYTGEVFDAVYRWVAGASIPQRHRYLKWTPGVPLLESEDREAHRYVFRIAPDCNLQSSGGSVALGVDPDPFIDQYTIPLSEVQRALSGKQKRHSRNLLDALERAETNSALRLNSIEALLDTTCLTLHSARIAAPAAPAEESLCRSLDAEVAAIHEAAREMARCDTLQAELVATITPSRPSMW